MRRLILLLFCVALIAANVARPSTAARADGSMTIRIGWLPGLAGRLFAAQAGDAFKRDGLSASVVRFDDAPSLNDALRRNSIDIGYGAIGDFVVNAGAGSPLKIFAIEAELGKSEGLVSRAAVSIAGVKDLSGKKIGVPFGSSAWLAMIAAVEKSNIDPTALQIVNLPAPLLADAFNKGTIDAMWTSAPLLFDLRDHGGKIVTLDGAWLANATVWYGRTDYLASHRDAMRAFLHALDDGGGLIRTDRATVAKQMAEDMGIPQANADAALMQTTFPTFSDVLRPGYKLSLARPGRGLYALVARYAQALDKYGIRRERIDARTAIDASILRDFEHVR